MPEAASITGGCLCGAVRFTVTAPPLAVRTCWCRYCQYIASGSGTVNPTFLAEAVTIEGETRDFQSIADSGNVMHRRFCPTCGAHLFSNAESRPRVIVVRVGTLDDPEQTPPEMTIWAGRAPSWACIDEDAPKVDGPSPPIA
jgi:hypothetical protein